MQRPKQANRPRRGPNAMLALYDGIHVHNPDQLLGGVAASILDGPSTDTRCWTCQIKNFTNKNSHEKTKERKGK